MIACKRRGQFVVDVVRVVFLYGLVSASVCAGDDSQKKLVDQRVDELAEISNQVVKEGAPEVRHGKVKYAARVRATDVVTNVIIDRVEIVPLQGTAGRQAGGVKGEFEKTNTVSTASASRNSSVLLTTNTDAGRLRQGDYRPIGANDTSSSSRLVKSSSSGGCGQSVSRSEPMEIMAAPGE